MKMKKTVTKRVFSLGLVMAVMAQTTLLGGTVVQAGVNEGVDVTALSSQSIVRGVQNGATKLDMQLYGRYDSHAVSAVGGSLEIVEYNSKNGYAYAVSGVKGTLIAVSVEGPDDVSKLKEFKGEEYNVKNMVEGSTLENSDFVYGDMTSVAISPDGNKLAVAVQHEAYDKAGAIVVFSCKADGSISDPKVYKAGVQPDMVTFADNNTVLSADEGEPRNGYGAGTVDPEGSVTILNLDSEKSKQVGFGDYIAEDLIAKNVLVSTVDGKAIAPKKDLEPEYMAVSKDGSKAYVVLQEANAVAILDIKKAKFKGVYSVGYEDFSRVPVDIVNDGTYSPAVYDNLVGARMPDGIVCYEKGGKTYLGIANEGDSRVWGDYSNEIKTQAFTGADITVLNSSLTMGTPEGKTVMFGGRGFTMLEVTGSGLKEVYDSGAEFESVTADAFPSNFNCSNTSVLADSCSAKKGPEPENLTISQIGGRTFAFIAIERTGGIMAYDITIPKHSKNVNYINSRDFSSDIKGDVSPEGICTAIIDGKPVVLAAHEVSGTLSTYVLKKH